ncbi:MAG: DnaA/Hda family protein [Thermoplasmata archaeon]|nr:DnaA/Hda family protein [Thermoplasmata archaeon]
MVTDLRIPEGIVVRTAKGGPESLKAILADLKQYGFSGYLKVRLEKEIMSSIGYVVVEHGTPTMAIYEFEKSKPRELKRIYTGERSLRFILEDSQDRASNIEIHSRVSKEEFERRFPDAVINPEKAPVRTAEEVRKKAPAAPQPEEEEAETSDPNAERIEQWRRKGFVVDTLIEATERGPKALAEELEAFERDSQRLTQFEVVLNNFPVLGHEQEIEEIRSKLNDRSRIAEVESDIEFLQDKVRRRIQKRKADEASIKEEMERKKQEEKAADVYDLILKYQGDSEEGEVESENVCPTCGELLDAEGVCGRCKQEEAAPSYAKSLAKEMRFDNFIVGPSSKFPFTVAVAVASGGQAQYNPLLIFGGSGLGKTHLLFAIGNKVSEEGEDAKVLYIPSDRIVEAFDKARNEPGRLRRIRDDLRDADLLLIDDMQFLAASPIAQDELVKVIDYLVDESKQVVLASDRVPGHVPGMSDRLNARIQKGLTADIQPPDSDTRIAILKNKAQSKKLKLGDDLIAYIADRVTTNVRELESTLNKIVAFSTIMKMDIDLNLISDILKPLAPLQETRKEIMKEVKVLPGHCYLIEEEKPMYSNVLLARMMKEDDYRGLVITRMNPRRIRDEFETQPEILWLTDKDSSSEKTIPPSLEMIIHTIQGFMGEKKPGMVVLDGIQYLISSTNFDAVVRFLRSLIDEMSESTCILALSLSPETLLEQEVSILEREMEVLNLT